MQRIRLLLALLVLTVSHTSFAQPVDSQQPPSENKTVNFVTHATEEANQYENIGTKITVFSLIIGVYMFYGYKQKV